MLLSIYDPYEEVYNPITNYQVPLRHMASELLDEFGITDATELDSILQKVFEVCLLTDIPVRQHFKQVFLYSQGELQTDWMMSDFGIYLVLMNGNTINYNLAKAQLYILNRR